MDHHPFGHHHHRRDDDNREEEFPPPGRRYDEPPPPPQVSHVYHTSHLGGPPPMNMESNYVRPNYPPPQMDNNYGRPNQPQMDNNYERPNYGGSYNPPSGYSSVEHVSHESESVHDDDHHRFQPHVPSFFHRQTSSDPELIDKPSFRFILRLIPITHSLFVTGKLFLPLMIYQIHFNTGIKMRGTALK
ncbi:hypothetical protein RND71_002318 [Anisodus tanguticus]|uniref:Uncharacterized protein n=1 Tax=Anisodus tanguticus TaxID=243964 RepID=A0AAE1VWH1_9SOLA|nr:hypothetical protein RND71_002318 [Anisodus tanguticus]